MLRPPAGPAPVHVHAHEPLARMKNMDGRHVALNQKINKKFRGKLPPKTAPAGNTVTLPPSQVADTQAVIARNQRNADPNNVAPQTQRLEEYTLSLTKCPSCQAIFALQQSDNQSTIIHCKRCGTLSPPHQKAARQQQINLVRTTLARRDPVPTPAIKMNKQNDNGVGEGETDTIMAGTSDVPKPNPASQPVTQKMNERAPSQTSLATNHYGDATDDGDEDDVDEGDVNWLTNTLKALDGRWNKRWASVSAKLAQQERHNQSVLQELADIKKGQRQEAARAKLADETTQEAVQDIARKQDVLLETMNHHGSTVETLEETLVKSLEAKLENTLTSLQNKSPTPNEARQANTYGYARAAEQPAQSHAQDDREPVGKYTRMARRSQNNRKTATQTNGNLVTMYVRDWRSEPVGRVKKALRQEIAEWSENENMEDGATTEGTAEPDIDAIRHVNQFGTPAVPVMEIACTPEKLDLLERFFQANQIAIWTDINPFFEQSVDAADNSLDAKRYRIAHFTRLL